MIWLPTSVEKKHGHVLVSVISLYSDYTVGEYKMRTILPWDIYSGGGTRVPVPYHFFRFNESVFYVNGRREVYETNIVDQGQVVFNPYGREWVTEARTWRTVLFRKLHKIEWLFL